MGRAIWIGFKFVAGLGLGFTAGCMIAALLAPAAGEDVRQGIKDRLPGGSPRLPDESVTNSGSVTRAKSPVTAPNAPSGNGGLSSRLEAAKEAMKVERREHESAMFARFRRALATGRASEV